MAGSNRDSIARAFADFKPSPWGDQFLHYIPDTEAIKAQEELVRELKVELHKEMISISHKPILEQLRLIDSIKRLHISCHFEKDIEDALKNIYDKPDPCSDDLYLVSLRFRILRQHGFKVSCDVFKGLINSNGSLKEEANDEVQGLLSLYEACYLSIHGEDILDKALVFTTNKLKDLIQGDTLSYDLKEQVSHSLEIPLHKRLMHLESIYFMKVYYQDPTHNKTLLRFAKVCFNLLQSSHKQQLCDISRWWESIGLNAKFPIRDRIVESYVSGTAIHEPKYSLGKKISTLAIQITTTLDDVFDAYGIIDELKLFTDAVERWEKTCLKELPEDYRGIYKNLILDPFEEMERDLAIKGRSKYVDYARKEVKGVCRSYLIDAIWRQKKYIPTFDEYMEIIAVGAAGLTPLMVFSWLDMEMADHDEFQWICSSPKPIQSLCLLLRILNDIGTLQVDKVRGHIPFMIMSYMKQYSVTYEEACKVLLSKTHELWKDMNEAMMFPTEVPMPLLKCMLSVARIVEYTYFDGGDSFTLVNKRCRDDVENLFIHPIPM